MVWTIVLVILALWVLGLIAEIGGGLINLLLIVAAVVILYKLFAGRSAT